MADGVALGSENASGPGRRLPSARRSDWRFKWLLVTPAALLILAISIYPLLFSIWVTFVNYDFQIPGHAFVGLKNFEQVIFDPVARYSLLVTAGLTLSNVAVEFLLGLAVAMTLANTFRGRGFSFRLSSCRCSLARWSWARPGRCFSSDRSDRRTTFSACSWAMR